MKSIFQSRYRSLGVPAFSSVLILFFIFNTISAESTFECKNDGQCKCEGPKNTTNKTNIFTNIFFKQPGNFKVECKNGSFIKFKLIKKEDDAVTNIYVHKLLGISLRKKVFEKDAVTKIHVYESSGIILRKKDFEIFPDLLSLEVKNLNFDEIYNGDIFQGNYYLFY